MTGVSVVICCHNSSNRIAQVLSHLEKQHVPVNLKWEIVLIDNASTDDTQRLALQSWPSNHPTPLRIIDETKLGLSYARNRGLDVAKYPLVSFVDDDNLVSPNWVHLVSQVMSDHPEVGACGGFSEPVFQVPPPEWFNTYKDCYAAGPQGEEAGDITETRGFLWGAGLSVRVSAWQRLASKQFRFSLEDRTGTALGAGSDSELCYALRLTGWRLWYEPRLKMRHSISAKRLNWIYLRHVCRGFGASSVALAPYLYALQGKIGASFYVRIKQIWYWQLLATVMTLMRNPLKLTQSLLNDLEGDPEVLSLEGHIGKLLELIRRRQKFDSSFLQISRLA